MKSRLIVLPSLIAIILTAAFVSWAQEQPQSEKDLKFYIYSIDQLTSANSGLQEQLIENEKRISKLMAEKDSLVALLRKYEAGIITAVQQPVTAANAPLKEASKAPLTPSVPVDIGANFEEGYRKALEKFNQKDYREAISMFNALLQKSRDNSLSDNCQYWIGEAYYALKDYQQAIIEFEKVLTFTSTNKDDDSQLKLGLCYIHLEDKESAKRELTRLLSKYPNSEFTELSRKLLEGLE